jgi:alpha-tubulin suppressor-like RCC1 family protein
VVAIGQNYYGQCDVGNWINITQVETGGSHTVGLKADGTVVTVGIDAGGQYVISNWTDISQVAAGEFHTVGLKTNGTLVAAGPEVELAKWNLGVVEYNLTISSTAGGSVTTPGEGTFTYNDGMATRVVARPEEGYHFVNWSGNVDTVFDSNAAITVVTMRGDYDITANFASINWPLIGGVIAVVVVATGLAIFFVRRGRAARTERQGRRRGGRRKH